MRLILGGCLFALLLSGGRASAAEPAVAKPETKPETKVVRLAITPAVENRPVLKYQLLPTFVERRPGNAAVGYGKAAINYHWPEWETKTAGWLEADVEKFDRLTKGVDLSTIRSTATLELLKLASRREHCDWDLPLREQMFYTILLPEQNELRRLGRMAVVEARLAASQGKFEEAIENLKASYALARHNGQCPTLVSGLVSLTIANHTDWAVLDLAQRKGSPSLYAALAFRPRPLVDLRPGIEGEMYSLELSLPELREAVEAEPGSRNWNAAVSHLIDELRPLIPLVESGENPVKWSEFEGALIKIGVVAWTGVRKTEVQNYLISCGLPKARVEKMPEAQLLLAHSFLFYEEVRDEMFRWLAVPYWQAEPRIAALEDRLRRIKADRMELLPFASLLLPAIMRVGEAHARAERRGDVLQIVEALRLYAGKHDGNLPARLEDLQAATPTALIDAMTGKPLDYDLTGDKAVLTLRKERGAGTKDILVYEITTAK